MILDRIFRLFYLLDIHQLHTKSIPKDPEEIVSTMALYRPFSLLFLYVGYLVCQASVVALLISSLYLSFTFSFHCLFYGYQEFKEV
jgi:hypothetical protein